MLEYHGAAKNEIVPPNPPSPPPPSPMCIVGLVHAAKPSAHRPTLQHGIALPLRLLPASPVPQLPQERAVEDELLRPPRGWAKVLHPGLPQGGQREDVALRGARGRGPLLRGIVQQGRRWKVNIWYAYYRDFFFWWIGKPVDVLIRKFLTVTHIRKFVDLFSGGISSPWRFVMARRGAMINVCVLWCAAFCGSLPPRAAPQRLFFFVCHTYCTQTQGSLPLSVTLRH